jgi:sucrose-6-phosphate hydrolase SacC (GH32 family)
MVVILLLLCAASGFGQSYRPQFHFSPRQNWTNDPNGLVWFDGEYHLFFQYNPFGNKWGHMSWGHAVSRDLVRWEELPVALAEENGVMIFTGSTVVDERNTSGFCAGGKACMVAVYTGHSPGLQTQNVAYSNDRGRTWTKYAGNPVLDLQMKDFRDPHVFWSESARRWVMVVALPNEHKALFYGSRDLKKWERLSEFGPAGATGGQWECPTLTEVPVEGGGAKWVLKIGLNPGGLQGGSGEQYFVGSFDGARFVNENPASTTLWTDYGKDCYCALPFNHLPRGQAPVTIGWMNNWQYADKLPTSPWRGQMTIPRRLQLRKTAAGLRLAQMPVEVVWPASGNTFELKGSFRAGDGDAGWKIAGANGTSTIVGYDPAKREVYVDRTHSGNTGFSPQFPARVAAPVTGDPVDVTVLVDRSTIEVFANRGLAVISMLFYPPEGPLNAEH